MANLNLSQFGENTSVSDADYTFVWDSANSISKKVSRNSWLTSPSLSSSAPVTISQTWDDLPTAFTALKVNATSTNSAAASKLLDLQLGTASKFSVDKNGNIVTTGTTWTNTSGNNLTISLNGGGVITPRILMADSSAMVGTDQYGSGINLASGSSIGWSNSGAAFQAGSPRLFRDGENTLALRNGANAQTFRVYNTYSDGGVNYERGFMRWNANVLEIGREFAGSGSNRDVRIISQFLAINVNGVDKFIFGSSSHASNANLVFGADNTYDIGASGAVRPRNVYVGSQLAVGTTATFGSFIYAENYYFSTAKGLLAAPSDGVFTFSNRAATDFTRLGFGGTTDAFPAVARDGAGIKFTGAAAGSTSWIKVPPVAVSALPLANTAGAGARAFVNDASAPVFGMAVTGGGAVLVPVYSDGSAWNVG